MCFLFTESILDPFSGISEMDDFDPLTLGTSDFLLDRAGPGSSSDPFSLPIDSFISLSPPQTQDYHFGLEDHEGISELFDCDFTDFGPLFWKSPLTSSFSFTLFFGLWTKNIGTHSFKALFD